jgi:hypothetical protein
LWVLAAVAPAVPAHAVDGVKLINQTVAMNGTASPGDEPGFPVTISEPGSYRLSGNLVVRTATTTAIEITADDVTLDLNGFAIIGRPVCLAPVGGSCIPTGIGIKGIDVDNVTVVNGSIRELGSHGIWLRGAGHRVERVRVMGNGDSGIHVGDQAIVAGNIAVGNGLDGIATGGGSVVAGNAVHGNTRTGIDAKAGSIVSGNTVTFHGFGGIKMGNGGLVTGNVIRSNDFSDLAVGTFAAYSHNVLSGTDVGVSGFGISAGHNVCNNDLSCP